MNPAGDLCIAQALEALAKIEKHLNLSRPQKPKTLKSKPTSPTVSVQDTTEISRMRDQEKPPDYHRNDQH